MDYFGTSIEIKAVDIEQRIISGHAAAHSNLDRVRDIIDPVASVKAVRRLGNPADVAVFIGHQHDSLPVGIPLKIEATPEGLYTETLIKPGVFGDDLLQTARFLQEHGQPLGMSIGYQTQESRPDRVQGKMVRRIMDYTLKEFSYAANQMIANPKALVTSVKALSEGTDTAGGAMVTEDRKDDDTYRIEERDGRFHVLEADGQSLIDFGTRVEAAAALAALQADQREDDAEGEKTEGTMPDEVKAVWTTKYVNDLPDSAFLFVGEGGQKDSEGKTFPRDLRKFPYKDDSGKLDFPHLRNAIARIPQATGVDDATKTRLQAKARKMLEDAGSGKLVDESPEWQTGAPIDLRALAYRLLDLSDQAAGELKAMRLLGEETKDNCRMRQSLRDELTLITHDLAGISRWAETIDRGEDALAIRQRYAYQMQAALDI
jgi:hypothetical protein